MKLKSPKLINKTGIQENCRTINQVEEFRWHLNYKTKRSSYRDIES